MADNELAVQTEQANELATVNTQNLLQNTKTLAILSRIADRYANSSMVPDTYKGKPDNCFVAVELASRMDVSPTLVMQNLYIVSGRPGWSGSACKALIDGCRKFRDSDYIMVGNREDDSWGCYFQAVKISTGQVVKGTTITIKMAKDEGWYGKNGSKWKTMPEQMLKYRAASFFARTECPGALMGFQTVEEIEDVKGIEPEKNVVKISLEG